MSHRMVARVLVLVAVGPLAAAVACSSSSSTGSTGSDFDAGGAPAPDRLHDATTGVEPEGGPSFVGGDTGTTPGCVNLQCRQRSCPNGGTTSLSGRVVTGATGAYGAPDPVYNAIVYVPNSTPAPFKPGASCDKCGTPVSGNPVTTALTTYDGTFKLTNVPDGASIPLVIQVGRWRRQVVIPNVTACVDTPLTTEQTRLPRSQKEGDIPLHAIATSTYDPEECILRKMGVDDSEFTSPDLTGRVHLYTSSGAQAAKSTSAEMLWSGLPNLMKYDIVLLPCESLPQQNADAAYKAIVDYTSAGGRVFATDLSYPWIQSAPAPFPQTAVWTQWGNTDDPLPAKVDQSFPKGDALAKWLQAIGATTTAGDITLHETYHVVDAVNPPTSRWLYSVQPATLQTFSFNTPIGAADDAQCGRVAYSNFHIASANGIGGSVYPSECGTEPLTPQERVMEFMLLDLASCVQTDVTPPAPPPSTPK